MGTSASQRSPRSREWDAVNETYRSPRFAPRQVLARIVGALDDEFRAGLSDAAAASCLATVMRASDRLGALADEGARIALARELREQADAAIERNKTHSRFGEIGLDAIVRVAMNASPAATRSPAATAQAFVSEYLARTVAYLASRDVPAHIGGPRLKDTADAAQFVRQLEDACEATLREVDFGDLAPSADEATDPEAVRSALAMAVQRALQALSEGGRDAE